MDKKLLDRINELANKKELTAEEKQEQANLRKEYLRQFREGFRQQLEHIQVIDALGNDVTPQKIKEKRKKNG